MAGPNRQLSAQEISSISGPIRVTGEGFGLMHFNNGAELLRWQESHPGTHLWSPLNGTSSVTDSRENTNEPTEEVNLNTLEEGNRSFGEWLSDFWNKNYAWQYEDFKQNDPIFGLRRLDNFNNVNRLNPNFMNNWDILNNNLEMINIGGLGVPNKLSLSQLYGFGRDLYNGKNVLDSWYGLNTGFFTEELMAKHPILDSGINLAFDIGVPWATSKIRNATRFANALRFNRAINKAINNWDGTYPRSYFRDSHSMYSTGSPLYKIGSIEGTPLTILEAPIPAENLYPGFSSEIPTYLGDKYSPIPSQYTFSDFSNEMMFGANAEPKILPVTLVTSLNSPYKKYTLNTNGTYSEVFENPQHQVTQIHLPRAMKSLPLSLTGLYPIDAMAKNLLSWQNNRSFFVNPFDKGINASLRPDIKREFDRYYLEVMYPKLTSESYSPIHIQKPNLYYPDEYVFDLVKREDNNLKIPSSVMGDPNIPVPLLIHEVNNPIPNPAILINTDPTAWGVHWRPILSGESLALIFPTADESVVLPVGVHELTHATDIYLPRAAATMYENIANKLGFGYKPTELRAVTNEFRYLLYKNNLNINTISDQELLKIFENIDSAYSADILNNASRLGMSDKLLADLLRLMVRILPGAVPLYFMENQSEEQQSPQMYNKGGKINKLKYRNS